MVERRWIVLAAVLAVACQGAPTPTANTSPAKNTSPVASPTPSPAEGKGSPIPEPSPVPDLPLSKVGFSCRLPVLRRFSAPGDVAGAQGGFITFPQATYRVDPAGLIESEYLAQDSVTQATPALHGTGGDGFYDRAMKRWIPVGPGQTSPDGARYAYATTGASSTDPTKIHIVNVSTGAERVLSVATPAPGAASGVHVVDFDGSSVYIVSDQVEQYPRGLWRIDVATGSESQIREIDNVLLVRSGLAWVGVVDPRDPAPPNSGRSQPLFNSLRQINVATGATTEWYYAPGKAVTLLGLDSSSRPLISVSTGPGFDTSAGALRLLSTPGGPGIEVTPAGRWFNDPQADSGRIWLGNDQGIYLFTPSTGLRKVYAFRADSTLGESLIPAGFCR